MIFHTLMRSFHSEKLAKPVKVYERVYRKPLLLAGKMHFREFLIKNE